MNSTRSINRRDFCRFVPVVFGSSLLLLSNLSEAHAQAGYSARLIVEPENNVSMANFTFGGNENSFAYFYTNGGQTYGNSTNAPVPLSLGGGGSVDISAQDLSTGARLVTGTAAATWEITGPPSSTDYDVDVSVHPVRYFILRGTNWSADTIFGGAVSTDSQTSYVNSYDQRNDAPVLEYRRTLHTDPGASQAVSITRLTIPLTFVASKGDEFPGSIDFVYSALNIVDIQPV